MNVYWGLCEYIIAKLCLRGNISLMGWGDPLEHENLKNHSYKPNDITGQHNQRNW